MEITGKTLIDLGYRPGKWFKEAIDHANKNQLSGNELSKYLEMVSPTIHEPHKQGVDYFKNIKAESVEEMDNVKQVHYG